MSRLDYASDDLCTLTGFNAWLLRKAKRKGFWAKKLWRRSVKIFGQRNDLARHHALTCFGVRIGKYTYDFKQFLHHGILLDEIGAFCSIAHNVSITFAPHPLNGLSTHPAFYLPLFGLIKNPTTNLDGITHDVRKTTIGHDVWIGTNVTIMNGVNIGTGSVIGAGAVVTKDVPPYAIVVGVPARIIRYRFDEATIEGLLASRWWTWPDDVLRQKQPDLFDPQRIIT